MKNIKFIFLTLCIFVLSGNANAQSAQERSRQEFLDKKYSEIQNTCERYGFTKGTNEFANCMMQMEIQWNNNYNDSIKQMNDVFKNFNEAIKPPQIVPVCPGMLNARPGQYGPNC
jgi:type I restriction-modification system DNA methylase subunit